MTSDLIERLRKALERVAPGPWSVTDKGAAGDLYIDAPHNGDPSRRVSVAWDMRDAELAYFMLCQPDNICDLLDRIASLEKAMAEAREALEPFAVIGKDVAENHPGWDHDGFEFALLCYTVTLEPFRRGAALSSSKQKDGTE